MRVAVVGGAGFIGLHLCRGLRSLGHEVVVLDCFLHRGSQAKAQRAADRVVYCDAREVGALAGALASVAPSAVFNLATVSVRVAVDDPVKVAREVATIGAAVPEACLCASVGRYVYVSSSEVYGDALDGPLHEESIPRPRTAYGAAKLAGEHCAEGARCRGALEVVILRPFNAYGPGCHVGLGVAVEAIPKWIWAAARGEPLEVCGGGQTRDFTFVTDLTRGMVEVGLSDAAVGVGPINLASGMERSMMGVARDVARKAGNTDTRVVLKESRVGDLRRQVGCAARARALFGWEPVVTWEGGLTAAVRDCQVRSEAP